MCNFSTRKYCKDSFNVFPVPFAARDTVIVSSMYSSSLSYSTLSSLDKLREQKFNQKTINYLYTS